MTATEWSVYLETVAPEGAALPQEQTEDKVGQLMDALTDHHAITSAGRRALSVRLNVDDLTASVAIRQAREVVESWAEKIGLPAWPIVRLKRSAATCSRPSNASGTSRPGSAQEVTALVGVSRQRLRQLGAHAASPLQSSHWRPGPYGSVRPSSGSSTRGTGLRAASLLTSSRAARSAREDLLRRQIAMTCLAAKGESASGAIRASPRRGGTGQGLGGDMAHERTCSTALTRTTQLPPKDG